MYQFCSHFKVDPVLAADASSYQTAIRFASQQCVKGAGVGAGTLDDGMGMIVMGAIA